MERKLICVTANSVAGKQPLASCGSDVNRKLTELAAAGWRVAQMSFADTVSRGAVTRSIGYLLIERG